MPNSQFRKSIEKTRTSSIAKPNVLDQVTSSVVRYKNETKIAWSTWMKIKKLELSDIGPFPELVIEFPSSPGISLLCGDNGIGKTTILETIVGSFTSGRLHRLKRRMPAKQGSIRLEYDIEGVEKNINIRVKEFNPARGDNISADSNDGINIIHIRANREIQYFKQDSISRDPDFNPANFANSASQDANPNQIKSWFTNRYLLQHHQEDSGWTPQMRENLKTAISFFSLLDPGIKLRQVDVTNFDILVSTPNGVLPFEFLSSGFRSSYFLLLSIIKELEFRKLNVSASEFSGVILIDEIDLHLHPTWQQEIGIALKTAFPKAQIIATTHSPHVIQTAKANEVITLHRHKNGKVDAKSMTSDKYGYLGWTVEEILENVMGVEDTRTPTFRDAIQEFDAAIEKEDSKRLYAALVELREMLHINNPVRKLLEIQSAPYLHEDLEFEDDKGGDW